MLLLADADRARLTGRTATLVRALESNGALDWSFVESGQAIYDAVDPTIAREHFGYVDGTSQPILLADDRHKRERERFLGRIREGPRVVLTRDPLGPKGAVGSYLVFRKLEQRVAAFWTFRRRIAAELRISEDAAGAGQGESA